MQALNAKTLQSDNQNIHTLTLKGLGMGIPIPPDVSFKHTGTKGVHAPVYKVNRKLSQHVS